MGYLLHLETATKVCSVALSLKGELKQIEEVEEEGFSHGENLSGFIEKVVARENISMDAIKAISLSSGPGSYTGLRIGTSVAKGLCYALEIPLIAVNSLACLYELVKDEHPNRIVIPMIDARRMEVYSSVYDSKGGLLEEVQAKVIDELSFESYGEFVYCGDGAEKLKDVWMNRVGLNDVKTLSSAKGQVFVAYQKYCNEEFESLAYFEPFYLKDFMVNKKKKV